MITEVKQYCDYYFKPEEIEQLEKEVVELHNQIDEKEEELKEHSKAVRESIAELKSQSKGNRTKILTGSMRKYMTVQKVLSLTEKTVHYIHPQTGNEFGHREATPEELDAAYDARQGHLFPDVADVDEETEKHFKGEMEPIGLDDDEDELEHDDVPLRHVEGGGK